MTTYTYTTFDGPGIPTGINDLDQMVGTYSNASDTYGFLYSNGVYTTINDPLSTISDTSAISINNLGQIVGSYSAPSINGAVPNGFLYSNGGYTTIDDPLGTSGTVATGINDLGQIVGYYFDGSGVPSHGSLHRSNRH
jgi:uncharacterized membrane protein